jgi:uncharacterized protein
MRYLLLIFGIICVGLAFLGVILPGLPATPFLLLAVYAFARSSPKMHDWLLNHRVFGPVLRDFFERNGIRLPIKIFAIAMMWAMTLISVLWMIDGTVIKSLALVGALTGTLVLLRYPTIRD